MTATSFLVPAAGVITAPILARALGTDGRGELAAALAPAALMLAVATLGLPDALTYYLAKHPSSTRRTLLWTSLMTVGLGLVCVAATLAASSFLSSGNEELAQFILLASLCTVPALVVGVFRGAATGRQMWRAIAAERLILTSSRVLIFGGLWLAGQLTVLGAVIVSVAGPVVAGLVYARLLSRPPTRLDEPPTIGSPTREVVTFGARVWFGSVASMMLSRSAQLLMAPLSSPTDLGLFVVATTISDMPLLVALAIQGALFGVSAKTADAGQITATTRLTLLASLAGCGIIAATVPLWIEPLFGAEFGAATVPTLLLLLSAVLCVPGLLAASGLSAFGRPGLRSLGLSLTLVVNVGSFIALVPLLGVVGACISSIVGNVVMSGFMIAASCRVMNVRPAAFLVIRAADIRRAIAEVRRALDKLRRRDKVPV